MATRHEVTRTLLMLRSSIREWDRIDEPLPLAKVEVQLEIIAADS